MKKRMALVLTYLLMTIGFAGIYPANTVQAATVKTEKTETAEKAEKSELAETAEKTEKAELAEAAEKAEEIEKADDAEASRVHKDAGWATTSIGPVKVNAPKKWLMEDGLYSPGVQNKENYGFYIAIEYIEDGQIKDLVKNDLAKYDDVYVDDDEFDGHAVKFVAYTYFDEDAGFEIMDFVYYIQVSPDGGACALVYDAPSEVFDEFVDDYFEVVKSVEIDDTKVAKEPEEPTAQPEATTSYVANTNTKKFHKPTCSSVSQMSEKNKLYYEGTRDELINQGYDPCKKCKP